MKRNPLTIETPTKTKPYFHLTGMMNGKQIRKRFATEAEAVAEKIALECQLANIPRPVSVVTSLTPGQAKIAERAFAELKPGGDMITAIRFYNDNWKPPTKPTTLKDAFEKFKTEKQRQNRRPETLRNIRARLGGFVEWMPAGKLVSEVMPDQIKAFLHRDTGNTRTYRTIKNDALVLSAFFNWAVEEEFCQETPLKKSVRKIRVDSKRPTILSIAECRKLMASARGYKSGRHVPYFALALFCGLRPYECQRMKWDNIDLTEKEIRIDPEMSKTRKDRFVKIPDNAVEWLLPHALKKHPFKVDARHLQAIRTAAGLHKAVQDICRHTAISHYQAKNLHEGLTAEWAGNSVAVVKRHYKKAVKAKEAEEFYAITPATVEAEIVSLKAA